MEPKRPNRRWLPAAALVLAILMLVLGETALEGRLTAGAFAAYWLVCVAFTVSAILASFVHLKEIQRTTRQAQHELLEDTLRQVREQARERHKKSSEPQA